MDYPLPSGVPTIPPYPSAPSTSAAPPPAADWPHTAAPAYDLHDYSSSFLHSDPLSDPDDRF